MFADLGEIFQAEEIAQICKSLSHHTKNIPFISRSVIPARPFGLKIFSPYNLLTSNIPGNPLKNPLSNPTVDIAVDVLQPLRILPVREESRFDDYCSALHLVEE